MKKTLFILSVFIYSSLVHAATPAPTLTDGYYYDSTSSTSCFIVATQAGTQLTLQTFSAPGKVCLLNSINGQDDVPQTQVLKQLPQRADVFYEIVDGIGLNDGPGMIFARIENSSTFDINPADNDLTGYSDAQIAAVLVTISPTDPVWDSLLNTNTFVRGAPQS